MKKRIAGLSQAAQPRNELPDGVYLARVVRMQYRWDKQKPFYVVRMNIVEPEHLADASVSGRLYCTEKAVWKLSWFLRDFGYDTELLARDELDETRVVGLSGVVKISHTTVNGRSYLNLDAFAPAGEWNEYSPLPPQSEPVMQYGKEGEEPEVA